MGRAQDFRHFIEAAASGGLRAAHQVPLAILAPALRARVEVESRVMPIHAGTVQHGARHIWMRHGPDSTDRAWKRLRFGDWLQVQRLLDEAELVRRRGGRWTFTGGAWARAGRQGIGFRLVAEAIGGELTPVTFFRIAAGR